MKFGKLFVLAATGVLLALIAAPTGVQAAVSLDRSLGEPSIAVQRSSGNYNFKFKVNYIGAYMTCERAILNGQKAIDAQFALDSQISGYLYCIFPGNIKGAKTTYVCAKTQVKGKPVLMSLRPRNALSQFVDCLTPDAIIASPD